MICQFCHGAKQYPVTGAERQLICSACNGTGQVENGYILPVMLDCSKLLKIKVSCKCGVAILLHIPDELRSAHFIQKCPKCSTIFDVIYNLDAGKWQYRAVDETVAEKITKLPMMPGGFSVN